MCYSAESATRRLIEYAYQRGEVEYAIQLEQYLKELLKETKPIHFTSGFSYPKLLVFTNEEPLKPQLFSWGLIPSWTKDLDSATKNRRHTLNARCETMFDLNSFKSSALNKRCLIYLDSFYEYHTQGKKKYPFRISMIDNKPFAIAGLWSEWIDKQTGEIINTCCIVTTEANPLMSKIHNMPAVSDTPRMPVILTKEKQNEWLIDIKDDADKKRILNLCVPFDESLMSAHTVGQLIGKSGLGNVPEAKNEFRYSDLDYTKF